MKMAQCPKCLAFSGDNWKQCNGKCPLSISPHFDQATRDEYGDMKMVEIRSKIAMNSKRADRNMETNSKNYDVVHLVEGIVRRDCE